MLTGFLYFGSFVCFMIGMILCVGKEWNAATFFVITAMYLEWSAYRRECEE